MKKLIIFAVALLALGFAANSFAIQAEIPADTTAAIAKGGTQITIGGDLRVRGLSYNDTSDWNSHVTSDRRGKNERMTFDYRYRLSVKAQVTPNTIGFLQLQVGEDTAAGQNGIMGNPTCGSDAGSCFDGRGTFQAGEMNTNTVRLNQAWIQHSGSGLIGVPAYIKVGHQPITVGAGIFYKHAYNNDDAFVLGISPIKGLDLTFLTSKLAENTELSADDMDLYSFMVTYAPNKNWKVGFDASLLQVQHTGYDFVASGDPPVIDGLKANLWNIGLNVKGSPVPGLKIYATGDMQFGDLKDYANQTGHFRGYAFTFGGSYKFAPVTLALDFGYGSGDNGVYPRGGKSNNKFKTFMTAQDNTVHYAFVYDYHTVNAGGNTAGGLQNTMFAKFGVNGDVMKNLNLGGSLIFLNAAQKTFGDGITREGWRTTSRYIGTELDFTGTYKIDKGLKYFVEAGYLFAGNYFKSVFSDHGSNLPGRISDPWVVRHGIQLSF